jgi:hypothetical protein
VVDVDGTRATVRQRALPQTEVLPTLHRRFDQVCAPGYTGRKRGEVVRTRTVILQVHTHQLLGTFGGPGNGDWRGKLQRAVGVVHRSGLDKRLMRAPQLYSRIGFAQKIEPLSDDETRFFLDRRWSHRVSAHSDDFTDQEAVAAILRITRGNIRLIERLMMQVEHILANQLQVVTKEVVETAHDNLIIGD